MLVLINSNDGKDVEFIDLNINKKVKSVSNNYLKDRRFFAKNIFIFDDEIVFVLGMLSECELSMGKEDLSCIC